jgi:hypothetical protein
MNKYLVEVKKRVNMSGQIVVLAKNKSDAEEKALVVAKDADIEWYVSDERVYDTGDVENYGD